MIRRGIRERVFGTGLCGAPARLFPAILALSIALVGCQTYNVQTDWDPSIAFGRLQSFYFVDPPEIEGMDPFADNSLLRKRVRFAVETALTERGYRPASSRSQADFLVTFLVILDDRYQVSGASLDGRGFRRRGGHLGHSHSITDLYAYQESTLILDLLDPSTEELLWRGWGTGIVGTRSRDRGRERMEKGVRAILRAFPPQAPSADG